jgi:hypothetical protein
MGGGPPDYKKVRRLSKWWQAHYEAKGCHRIKAERIARAKAIKGRVPLYGV